MHFFSSDFKKEILNFSLAIHRVTDLFPKTEPLRLKLREYAMKIVVCINAREFSGGSQMPSLHDAIIFIEVLKDFIWVSRENGLMKAVNAEVLYRECSMLSAYFHHELAFFENDTKKEHNVVLSRNAYDSVLKTTGKDMQNHSETERQSARLPAEDVGFTVNDIIKNSTNNSQQNERQKAIISYLRASKEARINEIASIFANRFSVKTLQRDLSRLILGQKVFREGDKRWAVYRLK